MRIIKVSYIVMCVVYGTIAKGDFGCMDNSWHLEKEVDDKSYHYVECYCPCAKKYKQLADRGICTKCRHFHDPQPLIILNVSQPRVDDMPDAKALATASTNIIASYFEKLKN